LLTSQVMTESVRPPFRADQVGSLLRPAEVQQARAKVEHGEMTAEVPRGIEDRHIRNAVARQEEIRDLAAAGCTYLQIDDTSFSFLCDEKFRESCRSQPLTGKAFGRTMRAEAQRWRELAQMAGVKDE